LHGGEEVKPERILIAVLLLLCMTVCMAQAAPTTDLRVVKLAADGTTILAERTVSYQWLEGNLPVQGDGATHYYHQGPVFEQDQAARWDPNETTNFKDHGAVKGTDVKDLCNLVGGAAPGDEVMIRAIDGYHVEFPYKNIYNPEPRQGPIVVCWYNGEENPVGERQGVGYPPDYYVGMRLTFFADTSTNAEGKHVFGNWDMHEVMPEEDIHLFDNLYPSTNGYTVKWIDEVRIYSGGYHGEKGSTVKSLSASAETTTAHAQSPLSVMPILLAMILLLLVVRRSR
jgi:hypothetical protein